MTVTHYVRTENGVSTLVPADKAIAEGRAAEMDRFGPRTFVGLFAVPGKGCWDFTYRGEELRVTLRPATPQEAAALSAPAIAPQDIRPGDTVAAFSTSSSPKPFRITVDRAPWKVNARTTALTDGRSMYDAQTATLRLVNRPNTGTIDDTGAHHEAGSRTAERATEQRSGAQ